MPNSGRWFDLISRRPCRGHVTAREIHAAHWEPFGPYFASEGAIVTIGTFLRKRQVSVIWKHPTQSTPRYRKV